MSVMAEFRTPVTAYPLSEELADHPDVSIEIDDIIPTGGSSRYIWVNGEAYHDLIDDLRVNPDLGNVTVLDELPDRALVRFEWETDRSPVFDLVEEAGGRIAGAEGTPEGWALVINFPSQEDLRTFYELTQERGLDIRLQNLYEEDSPFPVDQFDISPKQRETLDVALAAGYFEVPRRATLADLADELGVSERLRRGLSTFLATMLTDDGGPESEDGYGRND
jgi:predicted DNA binding protein